MPRSAQLTHGSMQSAAICVLVAIVVTICTAPPASADWIVHAVRCTSEVADGVCISLNAAVVEFQLANGNVVSWPRDELVSMTAVPSQATMPLPFPLSFSEAKPPAEAGGLLVLPNDDRIVNSSATPGETALSIGHAASASLIEVPWESITYWMQTTAPPSAALLSGQPSRTDRLLLSNGDLISGELTQFGSTALQIETAAGELTVGSERITAVSFNPELVSLPELPESWGVLQLIDGTRLTVSNCELRGDSLQIALQFGAEIRLPIEVVTAMQFYSKRVISLSTLPIADWEYVPYVPSMLEAASGDESAVPMIDRANLLSRANPAWNRSPLGGPLRMRGEEFPRGIGMRPRSRLTFNLDGEFEQFQSIVGIDDRAQGRGSVELRIESNDEVLWASPTLTGDAPPLDTGRIDIRGRRELTLVVDFAEWGDLHDLADWGNPILIHTPAGN